GGLPPVVSVRQPWSGSLNVVWVIGLAKIPEECPERQSISPGKPLLTGENAELSPPEERIGGTFRADRAGRPVSGKDPGLRRKGEKLAADALKQELVIPSGKVGTADRSFEKGVSRIKLRHFREMECHAVGGVSGHVGKTDIRAADLKNL